MVDFVNEDVQQFDGKTVALLRELKISLYEMARIAETEKSSTQSNAEGMMRLIDSYITACQTVYGQQTLTYAPLALGSAMYDVAAELRQEQGQRLTVEPRAQVSVASHLRTLNGMLHSFIYAMRDITASPLVLRSYMSNDRSVGVGVFAKNVDLTNKELTQALQTVGSVSMPMATQTAGSGVMLVIADQLAAALGGKLEVKRLGPLRGFATVVPKSEQLALL